MVRYSQKNKKKVAKKQSFKKKRVGGDDSVVPDTTAENTKIEDEPKDEPKDESQPNEYDSWVQSLVEAKDETSVKNALKVLYIDKHSIERIVTNVGDGDAFDTKYEVGSSQANDSASNKANANALNKIRQEGGKSINGTNACWINAPVYAFAAHPSLLSLVEANGGALRM